MDAYLSACWTACITSCVCTFAIKICRCQHRYCICSRLSRGIWVGRIDRQLSESPCSLQVLDCGGLLSIGCEMQASVRPAKASTGTSTWALFGHDSSGRSSCEHTLQAGQDVCAEVDLRDAYGNLAGELAGVRRLHSDCLICHSCCWVLLQNSPPAQGCHIDTNDRSNSA